MILKIPNSTIPAKRQDEEKQRLSEFQSNSMPPKKALQQKYGRQREQQERRKQNSC
jgi:hypothetical protein